MSKSLIHAASGVAAQLVRAETAIDTIVHETAALSVSMIETRRMGQLPLSTGQGALSDVAEATQLAIRARFHLVRAHSRLAQDANFLGLDWSEAWGDVLPTPTPGQGMSPAAALVREG